MSTLSSASTDAQVWAAYDDNASYEEDHSPTKAAAFITACRLILRRRGQINRFSSRETTFESIKSEMEAARQWLKANPTTAQKAARLSTRYVSFADFRN